MFKSTFQEFLSCAEMSGVGKKRVRPQKEEGSADEGDAGSWECTVCTFRNRFEAFKCEMCDTRKGTSTRKPKLNENVVQMQKVVQNFVVQQQEKAAINFKRRTQQSVGSPSTSRHSPESSSSGSAVRSLNTHGGIVKNRRRMILVPDHLIYRTSPKKITVIANGVSATITEYRRKPISSERIGVSRQLNNATTRSSTVS
uniref:RanBP2-type domain-containing protein n=1 Tax=Heterorhabditis bacteriophora TaxID=37862 RepID=A0A1I7X5G5_HETBA